MPTDPKKPLPVVLFLCALNWLVPGAGYLAAGQRARGLWLFGLLNGFFVLGILLDGTMIVPDLQFGSQTFNIVNVLTFLVKLCHGGGSLLLILLQSAPDPSPLLVRDPATAISDLGTFHLLVVGGLNYFATMHLFDLLTGQTKELAEDEAELVPGEASA